MKLRFILGRAGCGKTAACHREIVGHLRQEPDGSPLVLLVPEQATFQNETALAVGSGLGGFMRLQVLSFRRLAWRVLQEAGGSTRVYLGDLGKHMVIRALLQKNKSSLGIFHRMVAQPGFPGALAEIVTEIKAYGLMPGQLGEASELLKGIPGDTLGAKLKDIDLIYRELEGYLRDKYIDPDDALALLAAQISSSSLVDGGVFWLDGFSGFTPAEYKVINELIKHAREVNITLCMEPEGQSAVEEMFKITMDSYNRLRSMAEKLGAEVLEPLRLNEGHRYIKAPDLAYLEKKYFITKLESYPGSCSGLEIVAASSRRAEVEAAARRLLALCREDGCRWSQAAVLLRDIDTYGDLIKTVFTDHDIPFFIDQKSTLIYHPLVELIRSALEAVSTGWAPEPVLRYIKTDLTGVSRSEADILENYVLAHGIRGPVWQRQWKYRRKYTLGEDQDIPDQEDSEVLEVNSIKNRAVPELLDFYLGIKSLFNGKGQPDTREITTLLYKLLESLGVPSKLERWSKKEQVQGRLASAREHSLAWQGVVDLMDQLVAALGEEQISFKEYCRIMETGLEALTTAYIPPSLDQVLVCSLGRSRTPEVVLALVLGVGDGVLPASLKDKGIFNGHDRLRLESMGMALAPGARDRIYQEQHMVYTALTRATEKLWLSYPLADEEGKSLSPSRIIKRVKELFPAVIEREVYSDPGQDPLDQTQYISRPRVTLSHLAARLRDARSGRQVEPIWWDVYNWFVLRQDYLAELTRVIKGLGHQNYAPPLGDGISKSIFGARKIKTSVSRLEKFMACPFSHYLGHGLRLKPRQIYKLGAPDLGQFFHAALSLLGGRIQELGISWGSLGEAQLGQLVRQVVQLLVPQLQNEILLSTAKFRHLTVRLERQVLRAALTIAEHDRRGIFRPVLFEVGFGQGETLRGLQYNLSPEMTIELNGRIDRVDLAASPLGKYVRVVDYKSGFKNLSLEEVFHGINIQLILYLEVLLSHDEGVLPAGLLPGGVLYFTVADPMIRENGPLGRDELEKRILRALKMKGLLLADSRVINMMDSGIAGASSDILQVAINKDGNFKKDSPVLTLNQFEMLRQYINKMIVTAGQGIARGEIGIEPLALGGKSPCRFCQFKPVCQFDSIFPGNLQREAKSGDSQQLWQKIKEALDKE